MGSTSLNNSEHNIKFYPRKILNDTLLLTLLTKLSAFDCCLNHQYHLTSFEKCVGA